MRSVNLDFTFSKQFLDNWARIFTIAVIQGNLLLVMKWHFSVPGSCPLFFFLSLSYFSSFFF